MKNFGKIASIIALASATLFVTATQKAFADSFTVSYMDAGVQTPSGITNHYETFNEWYFNGVTNFNNSSILGTYSSGYSIEGAGQFGGAGGSGNYIAAPRGGSYSLTLSSAVNYFGLWFSALDAGNQLSFYNGNTLVDTFSPTNYSQLVGVCPTTAAAPNYCGNPNSNLYGLNGGQQYAYLNFYDTTGTFNKIVFSENPAVGEFESDNQAVAVLSPGTNLPGTTLTGVTPEPSSFILLGTGLLGAVGVMRRRMAL